MDQGKKILEEKLTLETRENMMDYFSFYRPTIIKRQSAKTASALYNSSVEELMTGKPSKSKTPAN